MKWNPSYRHEYDIDSWVEEEGEEVVEEMLHHVVGVSAEEAPQLNLYLTLDLSVHLVARNDVTAFSSWYYQVVAF